MQTSQWYTSYSRSSDFSFFLLDLSWDDDIFKMICSLCMCTYCANKFRIRIGVLLHFYLLVFPKISFAFDGSRWFYSMDEIRVWKYFSHRKRWINHYTHYIISVRLAAVVTGTQSQCINVKNVENKQFRLDILEFWILLWLLSAYSVGFRGYSLV